MTRKSSAYTISILGILGALIILQAYIPMVGYIRIIPGLPAISTIHLTVILGGVILGVRGGATLGLLWGCISLLKAYTSAADPVTLLLFQNPIIAIVPRIMVGVVAALIFNHIASKTRTGLGGTIKMVLAGIAGALTNTLLVIAFTWLLFASQAGKVVHGANASNLGWLLIASLAVNAIAEATMAGIVTPILGQALLRFKR
ncbi:ECF transporter S component [Lacticaseibacillus nasuensis]|uniref:Membrane protein n=1 Tax=Lacticaseibacillus nasuensis JCM 17158 TaxID=1291734 RepID=A0A0R1JK14_9LACO|nr:ECF transporter S component [Lacticaseibacillus nasuensis]KRK71693.1 membrane protein [Lacticaseibacillus nasuensis JCM 17158]